MIVYVVVGIQDGMFYDVYASRVAAEAVVKDLNRNADGIAFWEIEERDTR